jgi:hypothetical protein
MVIEAIFAGFTKTLLVDPLTECIRMGFRAMVEQEIETTDLNRLISEPMRSAHSHLRNAEFEANEGRRREHLEYARLDFVKAANQDAPLPAARAACYAGFCHRLRGETQELDWYERSRSMIVEIETGLETKLARILDPNKLRGTTKAAKTLQGAALVAALWAPITLAAPVAIPAIVTGAFLLKVRKNLNGQLQTVREHKDAVNAIIKAAVEQDPSTQLPR